MIFLKKDNVVYLLVGQRGAGKSYYANKLVQNDPDLILVSRDEILIRLFGSADTNPYSGAHCLAEDEMHQLLKSKLTKKVESN